MTPAHHRPGGGFQNPWPNGLPNRLGAILKWRFVDRVVRPPAPDPDPSVFPRVAPAFPAPRGAPDRLTLTWVGHATFLVQLGGVNLLTDPMWGERASPIPFLGPRRWVAPGIALEALPPIDAVLLSHNHYDHLDASSVRRLVRRYPAVRWLVPLGLAPFLRGRGAADVTEYDWWDEARVGSVSLTCTPARHFSARGLRDRNATLWCGWAVASARQRLFFAGDTALHPEFATIGARCGPFDVALLPVGAYDPRWFMKSVHMNPEEAVRAFQALTAGAPAAPAAAPPVMVPMHWGTFKLTDEPMDEPPARVRAAWQAARLDPGQLWLPAHGQSRTL
jgi:N-acyl-phosphatidylethanolamine-hydrolysing phospholipase D